MPRDDVTSRPVGGRYELRELLGRGGMGTVWRAEDLLLERPVAVKRVELPLHLPEADRDALRQRVLREARAAARVSHPRLVTIFDVVEEEGTVFLVQELVDAPTLKALVAERGALPPVQVASIGRQLVEGLAAAHRSGVVHRDVKPSNVMVLPDGGVKLADFGIASLHGDPQITATGVVVGSPAYMAPEQAVGEKAGPAADLWSVGATLYFAVEGEPPFGRADTLSTLTAVVNEAPRAMVIAGPLAPLLGRLLSKAPDDRPSAAEVLAALQDVGAGAERTTAAMTEVRSTGHVAETRVAPAPVPVPVPTSVAVPTPPRPTVVAAPAAAFEDERFPTDGVPLEDRRGKRRGLAVATVVVLILLVGGFALAAGLGRRSGDGGGGEGGVAASGDATTATSSATPTTAARAATPTSATRNPTVATAAPTTTAAGAGAAAPTAGAGAATVPAGWTTYTDPKTGYTVAHPPSWRVQPRDGTRTDIVDPATGSYLRIDWTDKPGPSAQADWERQSKSFGATHTGYEEIGITPTTFQGSKNASLWEYRYTAGGATLHAVNLGFVLPDGRYGFALNFQTRESDWTASQTLWEQLKAGYSPPR